MKRIVKVLGVLLMPLGVGLFELAVLFPETTEHWYSERFYPLVARSFGLVNRSSFSYAEWLLAAGVLAVAFALYRVLRATERGRRWRRALGTLWVSAGVLLWWFLSVWGLNYARPPLEVRLGLRTERSPSPEALLDAASRVADETSRLFLSLDYDKRSPRRSLGEGGPTHLPLTLAELNARIDEGYRELALPGDAITSTTTPAKPLASSIAFSYLGISGIFVPFTGEPSFNALQPDVAMPIVLAHEKAHQRGITNEGEANFAAFLVCAREDAPVYLRYAAYLFAAQYLIGEASNYFPREELGSVWERLGDGPLADVRAERDFWRQYEGPAAEVASHVNDGYLKAFHVPEGISSYGTVVRMLLALDERGRLVPATR